MIAYKNGAPIRLAEVANVVDGVENAQLAGWANQKRAVIVNVDELGVAGPAAANLLQRGAEAVIVTRGAEGITIVTPGEEVSIAAERAGSVLDATGAGDAFSGAVAAFLAEGLQLEAAARKANVAAGLSVLRPGARGGIPTRAELEGYLKQSPSV